jgi:WD40 repeat protein
MPPRVWDAKTGQGRVEFPGHREIVFCVAWQPDGQRLAAAGGNGALFTVKVWDAKTRHEVFTLPKVPGGSEFFAVAYSTDGRYLVTGRQNATVQVWDARTGDEVRTLGAHDREIRGLAFSRDGRHLASASGSGTRPAWTRSKKPATPSARGSPGRI